MLTYITAIHDALIDAPDWAAWLRARLAGAGITAGDDELLLHGDDVVGRYELIERDVAAARHGGSPWCSLEPRPWIGGVAGFFSWTHAADERAAMNHLVPVLIEQGRGVVARLDSGRYHQPVRARVFSLADLVRDHGFDDGDALLARDGAYLRYVLDEVQGRLAAAGLDAHVGAFSTAHNPIKLAGELRCDGIAIADPEPVLEPLSVELWSYDPAVLRDVAFWID